MPSPRDIARDRLAALLAEFEQMRAKVGTRGQSEATVRTWVERFLEIFGWDPADPSQVVQEFRIKGRNARRIEREGSHHNQPDYALVVNGEEKLFIDVKRFDVDIGEDDQPALQVRAYGRGCGLRLSYAFDFEELAIYDCSIPIRDRDTASTARVRYLRAKDYLASFDALWDYFARDAILAGSLERLHPEGELPRGSLPLDEEFEQMLSEWRLALAKTILRYGKTRDARIISGAAQRILDRIVFLRFCEEMGLEEYGSLNFMGNHEDGFWPLFMEEHEKRYRRVYDGILFPSSADADPTGVEKHLRRWWLKGRAFQQITRSLYNVGSYRFESMPIELLGGIYERFLGKRLRIVGNDVDDEFKPEYQRTKGAVYTPAWVVKRVVQRTLDPLAAGRDPEKLLALRIVDPACGSASFLLGVYDYLERALLDWFALHPDDSRRPSFVRDEPARPRLAPAVVRTLITDCIHGVDIDEQAVEVARMSLALRYLERTARDEPEEPAELLKGIGRNIRHGNSLVGPEQEGFGFDSKRAAALVLYDWHSPTRGFGHVMSAGGFDAVVGNPPYIEVKRYREWMPELYAHLKESGAYATAREGKTDISMPFIERAVQMLRPGGRLGYIVQNRFFKTEYGESARAWLRTHRLVEEIEDFRDIQVFAGRTTYTTILVLQKGCEAFRYRTYADRAAAQAEKPSVDARISIEDVGPGVWSFDQPDLLAVHRELGRRHGLIGQHREISIAVGLQTLYGKIYQLEPVDVRKLTVVGRNGFGDEVTIERRALRPLCRNRGFYPFRRDNADAWVVFPYQVDGDVAREILWPEFKKSFPKAAAYLDAHRKQIRDAVETESGANRWHLYTRPQNLAVQARPKVLFPSTIEDTIASADLEGDVYQDNVRINSMSVASDAVDLVAVAAVLNSSVFSALARLKAGLSDSGWRQFNRQFAELVPFPLAALRSGDASKRLRHLATQIQTMQESFDPNGGAGEGERQAVRSSLESLWARLDAEVEALYGLSPDERAVVARYPRRVDRVALLHRQVTEPDDSEET